MSTVKCPECGNTCDSSLLKTVSSSTLTASAGGWIGRSIGIAMGGSAISGFLPGIVLGSILGYGASKIFYVCDRCGTPFKT